MAVDDEVLEHLRRYTKRHWWGPVLDAEDVAMECYIKWKKAAVKYPERYGNPAPQQLVSIAKTRIIDLLRQHGRSVDTVNGLEEGLCWDAGDIPSDDIMALSMTEDLMAKVSYWLNVDEVGYNDIAQRLGIETNELRARYEQWFTEQSTEMG
jgi:DNA-directed RNA polymerase specialized sigma24 family protein